MDLLACLLLHYLGLRRRRARRSMRTRIPDGEMTTVLIRSRYNHAQQRGESVLYAARRRYSSPAAELLASRTPHKQRIVEGGAM